MERVVRVLRLDRCGDFVLEVLTGSAFAASVVGASVVTIARGRIGRPVVLAVAIALTLFYALAARAKDLSRTHRFEEGTKNEADFYAKWYSQRGQHTIFTNDFIWMTGTGDKILGTILAEPLNFTILVRDPNADNRRVMERLIEAGIKCVIVDPDSNVRVRFSLVRVDDHPWLIIRDKRRESRRNERVFRETDDDYTILVVEDLIRNCLVHEPHSTGDF